MNTFTIVAKDASPLGPFEIAAGDTIIVEPGATYIIAPSADHNVTFEGDGLVPATFNIVFANSNGNNFDVKIKEDLTPDIDIGPQVNLAQVKIDASDAEGLTLRTDDDVTLEQLDGSKGGSNTLSIGNRFTIEKDIRLGDAHVTARPAPLGMQKIRHLLKRHIRNKKPLIRHQEYLPLAQAS